MDAKTIARIREERIENTTQLDPQVPITLKKNRYTLEINNQTAIDILGDTGINLLSTGVSPDQWKDPKIVGAILYRALETHHPELDQKAVNRLFTLAHLLYISGQLRKAMSLYLPITEDLSPDDNQGEQVREDRQDP